MAVQGRSHFALRNPRKRRKPIEEEKEILITNSEYDIRNAELAVLVQKLEEKASEYKMLYIKYKEMIDELIEKGVINEHG